MAAYTIVSTSNLRTKLQFADLERILIARTRPLGRIDNVALTLALHGGIVSP
jgi:hypothetical protein